MPNLSYSITRRKLLKLLTSILMTIPFARFLFANQRSDELIGPKSVSTESNISLRNNIGVGVDGVSDVFFVKGGSPGENIIKLFDMIGGPGSIFGQNDIVVLKPNAQWRNQGMTNTDAMRSFIEILLAMPDFEGEVIIAENHQYKELNSRGWSTTQRNGSYNYNELIKYFNDRGYSNVTKYHWQCAGDNPVPLEANGCCGKRVSGPEEGDGYVWRDDIVYTAPNGNKCWMTYPIFTSQYSGITIDLKNGAWKDGQYLSDKPIKFINFSALNHHGPSAGVTASVKNLMGVVDMTCGFHAPAPAGTFNVHFVGVKKYIRYAERLHWRLSFLQKFIKRKASMKEFHYAGGALGYFMKHIRMPDLNIITAEWVGWGDRIDISRSSRPRSILASRDPVALDYVAAAEVLYPSTPPEEKKYRKLNDPFIKEGPFYKFLNECQRQGVGNIEKDKIRITKFHY